MNFEGFNEQADTGVVVIEFKDVSPFTETDVKVQFGDIYSDKMIHGVDSLACIGHNG